MSNGLYRLTDEREEEDIEEEGRNGRCDHSPPPRHSPPCTTIEITPVANGRTLGGKIIRHGYNLRERPQRVEKYEVRRNTHSYKLRQIPSSDEKFTLPREYPNRKSKKKSGDEKYKLAREYPTTSTRKNKSKAKTDGPASPDSSFGFGFDSGEDENVQEEREREMK